MFYKHTFHLPPMREGFLTYAITQMNLDTDTKCTQNKNIWLPENN